MKYLLMMLGACIEWALMGAVLASPGIVIVWAVLR